MAAREAAGRAQLSSASAFQLESCAPYIGYILVRYATGTVRVTLNNLKSNPHSESLTAVSHLGKPHENFWSDSTTFACYDWTMIHRLPSWCFKATVELIIWKAFHKFRKRHGSNSVARVGPVPYLHLSSINQRRHVWSTARKAVEETTPTATIQGPILEESLILRSRVSISNAP